MSLYSTQPKRILTSVCAHKESCLHCDIAQENESSFFDERLLPKRVSSLSALNPHLTGMLSSQRLHYLKMHRRKQRFLPAIKKKCEAFFLKLPRCPKASLHAMFSTNAQFAFFLPASARSITTYAFTQIAPSTCTRVLGKLDC